MILGIKRSSIGSSKDLNLKGDAVNKFECNKFDDLNVLDIFWNIFFPN